MVMDVMDFGCHYDYLWCRCRRTAECDNLSMGDDDFLIDDVSLFER